MEILHPDLLAKVQANELISEEEFMVLSAEQIVALAPTAMQSIWEQGVEDDGKAALWDAVNEYGLQNLPSDFLRVFYKHYYTPQL